MHAEVKGQAMAWHANVGLSHWASLVPWWFRSTDLGTADLEP